ncbi:MAG: hypothetical protein HYW01_00590 [Deltaproteobacteria bacterium]|nr:hypothetical protein [Deltaproteobacteria bacterium]
MKKPKKHLVYLLAALLTFTFIKIVHAQDNEMSSNFPSVILVQPLPGRISGPIVFNSGIVLPQENLGLFQYSNLKENGGSTFGEKIRRKSNLEINKPKKNRAMSPQTEKIESSKEVTQAEIGEETAPSFAPLSHKTTRFMYGQIKAELSI